MCEYICGRIVSILKLRRVLLNHMQLSIYSKNYSIRVGRKRKSSLNRRSYFSQNDNNKNSNKNLALCSQEEKKQNLL